MSALHVSPNTGETRIYNITISRCTVPVNYSLTYLPTQVVHDCPKESFPS